MVTACSQWIHSSSQLWGHVAAGKTNGWKCISIVSTRKRRSLARLKPSWAADSPPPPSGQRFRASHSVGQQHRPAKICAPCYIAQMHLCLSIRLLWIPLSLKLVFKKKRMQNEYFTSWRQFSICCSAGLKQTSEYTTSSNIQPKGEG